MEALQPWHIIIIVGIAILFFGGRKLPELGKGLGEGFRGFKEGLKGITDTTNNDKQDPPGATAHTVTPKAEDTKV